MRKELLELTTNNMLTNVTNNRKTLKTKQLFKFTCFIIYVGPYCIGEFAYA